MKTEIGKVVVLPLHAQGESSDSARAMFVRMVVPNRVFNAIQDLREQLTREGGKSVEYQDALGWSCCYARRPAAEGEVSPQFAFEHCAVVTSPRVEVGTKGFRFTAFEPLSNAVRMSCWIPLEEAVQVI